MFDKISNIIYLIYEVGDLFDPSNYRIIMVNHILVKVFAMILNEFMYSFVECITFMHWIKLAFIKTIALLITSSLYEPSLKKLKPTNERFTIILVSSFLTQDFGFERYLT